MKEGKVLADAFYGGVTPPAALQRFISSGGDKGGGLIVLVNTLLKFAVAIAGLYALVNFILAGYQFFSAAGDAQKVSKAWAKIWQTLLGLVVIAAAFLLTALAGLILFGDPQAFLQLKVWSPGP